MDVGGEVPSNVQDLTDLKPLPDVPLDGSQPEAVQSRMLSYERMIVDYQREISELQDELQRLRGESIRDDDTALFSSTYFYTRLQEEILRSERYRHFFSLILVHLEIKDPHSTQQLTRELKRIGSELMISFSRRTDTISLYRKRQMVIMLPETDPRGVQILLQRCQNMFPNTGRRLVCAALTYPNDASNIELVLNRLQELSENLFRGTDRARN